MCLFTSSVNAQKATFSGIKNELYFGLEMNCHGGLSLMPIADQTPSNYLITPSGYPAEYNTKIRYSATAAFFSGIGISPLIHKNFSYTFGLNGAAGWMLNDAHQEWSFTNRFEVGFPKVKFVLGLTKVKMRSAYTAYKTTEYSTSVERFGNFYLSNFRSLLLGLKYENDNFSIQGGVVLEHYKKPERSGSGCFFMFTHGNFSMFTRANFKVPVQVNPTRMTNPDVNSFNSSPRNYKVVLQFGIGVRLQKKYKFKSIFELE